MLCVQVFLSKITPPYCTGTVVGKRDDTSVKYGGGLVQAWHTASRHN